jgi:hypothetical protein
MLIEPRDGIIVAEYFETPYGTEYPWAYVNSWNNPETVLASSAADAIHDPQVRAGRPVAIDTDAIVDWAIWIDEQSIAEGGITNTVAH